MSPATVHLRRLCPCDLQPIDAVLMRAFGVSDSFRASLDRHVAIQPDGWLVAETENELAGIVGAVRFGSVAYIGMMGVAPEYQGRGIGAQLFEAVLTDVDRHGCTTLLLDATPSGERLYRRFGFVDDGITYDMRRIPGQVAASNSAQLQIHRIAALDLEAFGADRRGALRQLLSEAGSEAFAVESDGYAIAQSKVIGPLIARTPDIAERLMVCVQQSPAYRMMLPAENESSLSLLRRHGFEVQQGVKHMRRGLPLQRNRKLIYGQASFALG
jgi:ribosomal protein S18 acetylase RimI-like enzyme